MARKAIITVGDILPDCGEEDVPVEFRDIYLDLILLTDRFCQERLDEEYQELCREMALSVCQEGSLVARGKRASWASGIVYSVGWVNFLGDPSFEPYVRSEDIAKGFGVSAGMMHSKSKIIREGLDLMPMDPEFTLPSRLEENPLVWMLEIGGFLVDVRSVPREVQEAAYKQGLIPYVPADRGEIQSPYTVTHQRVGTPETKQPQSPRDGVGYQVKVTLDGSKPPIWRRLLIPDCALDELHELIQVAMGWEDYHLHEFQVGKERFGMAESDDFCEVDDELRQESSVLLSELVVAGHKKLRYSYDFGDDWQHTILIEKTLDRENSVNSPKCVAGARACPPEDCGGVWGYAAFLEAIADPKHEGHEEMCDWIGDEFDPEYFDLGGVNEELAL